MPEPFAIVAGVVGVIAATNTIAKELVTFIDNIKQVPETVLWISSDAQAVSSVLQSLLTALKNDAICLQLARRNSYRKTFASLKEHVQQCQLNLELIKKTIKSFVKSTQASNSRRSRMTAMGVFNRKSDDMKRELQSIKESLSMALALITYLSTKAEYTSLRKQILQLHERILNSKSDAYENQSDLSSVLSEQESSLRDFISDAASSIGLNFPADEPQSEDNFFDSGLNNTEHRNALRGGAHDTVGRDLTGGKLEEAALPLRSREVQSNDRLQSANNELRYHLLQFETMEQSFQEEPENISTRIECLENENARLAEELRFRQDHGASQQAENSRLASLNADLIVKSDEVEGINTKLRRDLQELEQVIDSLRQDVYKQTKDHEAKVEAPKQQWETRHVSIDNETTSTQEADVETQGQSKKCETCDDLKQQAKLWQQTAHEQAEMYRRDRQRFQKQIDDLMKAHKAQWMPFSKERQLEREIAAANKAISEQVTIQVKHLASMEQTRIRESAELVALRKACDEMTQELADLRGQAFLQRRTVTTFEAMSETSHSEGNDSELL
ncbi:hypothetical protein H2198_003829 [Neophaeococcomyces mojaviensis]|uniref:Uncharacterized protein n=1 Tax=Neophaeococcomyces mojaviensis TaxID=3383035 RepID=A0ACC3AAN2_9EURO|nr:hypothetical protein H2198_003829 [Knufia sp. JES_112]